MTQVIHSSQKMQQLRKEMKNASVGFVPTMGALHRGHEELIRQARASNDICVISIFVNPTQFNNPKDLQKYPSTWDSDLEMLIRNHVDFVFAPTYEELYPDQYAYKITENNFSKELCGAHRPGHFDGVLTVVMKLLNITQPNRAYFGEKDFQQLTLVKKMAEAFFLSTEIIAVPTVRQEDGLALSSRNVRLSEKQLALAPKLYKELSESTSAEEAKARLQELGFSVDYVTDIPGRRLAAATLGDVRLIDNVQI